MYTIKVQKCNAVTIENKTEVMVTPLCSYIKCCMVLYFFFIYRSIV